jgi:hypothetical protein
LEYIGTSSVYTGLPPQFLFLLPRYSSDVFYNLYILIIQLHRRYLYMPYPENAFNLRINDISEHICRQNCNPKSWIIQFLLHDFFFFRIRVLDLRLLECYFVCNTNGESIFDNYNNQIILIIQLHRRYLYMPYPEKAFNLRINDISEHICRQNCNPKSWIIQFLFSFNGMFSSVH